MLTTAHPETCRCLTCELATTLPHECDDWRDGECSRCEKLALDVEISRAVAEFRPYRAQRLRNMRGALATLDVTCSECGHFHTHGMCDLADDFCECREVF